MITKKKNKTFSFRLISGLKETLSITVAEFKLVFRDPGVLMLFVAASIAYPLLYSSIYKNETLTDIPVAVVDDSHSTTSRGLLRQLQSTPELKFAYQFNTIEEAKDAFYRHEVHGIVHFPSDFSDKINKSEQATVSIYSDMSSFLYYRTILSACNNTIIKQGEKIKIKRLNALGITGQSATISATPLPYEANVLYNPSVGFASFFLPAILILIIQQTLFLGIGMLAGTVREEDKYHMLIPENGNKRSIFRLISGKGLCYFTLYFVLSTYILGVIPRLFSLPHIGNFANVLWLIIPFLLATIFFSMTISIFVRNRETGMVVFLFLSLILLFMSGVSWPRSNINGFWLAVSWIFPSTHGIQAYIKINTMGATLKQVDFEYVSLWALAGFYFVTTIVVYRWQILTSRKRLANHSV